MVKSLRRIALCFFIGIGLFFSKIDFVVRYSGRRCPNGGQRITFSEIGNHGRLGNQLFQIASTIGIAESSGLEWSFPQSISTCAAGKLFHIEGDHSLGFSRHFEVSETSPFFHKIQIPLNAIKECTISLHGYFQSPEYFVNSHETLREYLKIPVQMKEKITTAVPEIDKHDSVAIHVRRGDYTEPPFNTLYSILDESYYVDALSQIAGVARVIIVTNDKNWCKRHLSPALGKRVIFSPFEDDMLDFILLHLARNIIIANSSYSWWAAYLRIIYGLPYNVFAPSVWYNMTGDFAHLNHDAFYPSLWTRV